MKNSFFYTPPTTKPLIKKHLAENFRPYKEVLEKLSLESIELEVFTEVYNKLAARIEQISFPESAIQHIPQINKEPDSIKAALISCREIQKDLANYLPENDFDGYFVYSIEYAKQHNIGVDTAKKVISYAYKKQYFQLQPAKNSEGDYNINEIVEKLITFCMLHLQSPIGTFDIVQASEINILKNEIYEIISEKVVVPYLAECFKMIQQEEDLLSLDSTDLFDMIMVLASDYRGRIAYMQTDPNADNMGLFTRDSSMRDPLENPSWQAWREKIATEIKKAIISGSKEITLDYKESMCMSLKESTGNLLKGIWHHKDDFMDFNPTNSHSACYHFAYKQHLANEIIEPLAITCVHKKFSQGQIGELGNDLKQILIANKDFLSENGSKLFTPFLWDIAGGSFLERGQAACTQFIMKGLAKAKGFVLSWSEEWTPPVHPNYDMQALSVFYKDVFIEEHSHNIILTEINSINLAGVIETSTDTVQ